MSLNSTQDNSGAVLENLYPALTQCFAIILCGYLAGRMNLISSTESKGINTFVGTFALPSLIFMSLAQLDLSAVNWTFLVAILLAKSIVFFFVILVTLLVGRPLNLGRAGIFAIFCTQSNDFAIGYPIVMALYKTTHPQYASYIYLMAPISLAILNPIAFILMELGKPSQTAAITLPVESLHRQRIKLVLSVAKNIFGNPIIFMTILGVIGNLIFNHNIPCYLAQVLDALGSAFSASALFLLGLRMVGKVHKLRGPTLVVPGILIIVKLLVFPLVNREVISLLRAGANASETSDLSTYGFFYGTFPSAPTVFVFATQYAIDVDLIASAMVACTFISAPLMFVSAKMITLTNTAPDDYIKQLDAFTFDISIIAILACLWVIFVFTITRKLTRLPHRITSYLILAQLLSCSGAILWNTLHQHTGWPGYIQFALFTTGVYSTRVWTAILAVTLLFLQCRSLCYVIKLQWLFILLGWILPLCLSIILLLFEHGAKTTPFDKRNPNFVYGISQAIVAIALLVISFIVTLGSLILLQRYNRIHSRYVDLSAQVAAAPIDENPSTSTNSSTLPTINENCEESSPVIDIEDLYLTQNLLQQPPADENERNLCPAHYTCQASKRQQCQSTLQQYQQQVDDDLEFIEEEPELHELQILRHTVLLILLLCSIFVAIALSIWTLVMEEMSGIYIELSFLDATLNFGQSIIIFGIFGLNVKEVGLPLLKVWRKLWYGANTLVLPQWDELSPQTKFICEQFRTHHLANCRAAIASDKRWRLKVYQNCFTGVKFVEWLCQVGLARDRVEAVNYARHLIEGKIIRHINAVYHFYDRSLLYTFCVER